MSFSVGAGSGATADVKAAFALATQATGVRRFRQVSPTRVNTPVQPGLPRPGRTSSSPSPRSRAPVRDGAGHAVLQPGVRHPEAYDAQGPVRRVVHAGIVLNDSFNSVIGGPKPADPDAGPDPDARDRRRPRARSRHVAQPADAQGRYDIDTAEWGDGGLAGLSKVGLVEGCVTDN